MIKHHLVLASESTRRADLLRQHGFRFTIHPSKISESLKKNLKVEAQIQDIAERKLAAVIKDLGPEPKVWLAADTMVVLDDEPLGKPDSVEHAVQMLTKLSSREHQVMTAISLWSSSTKKFKSALIKTKVQFKTLSPKSIEEYVTTQEPMDKAGAYGIQGLGRELVENFVGSYTNVMGLPMEDLLSILREPDFFVERNETP
jgi:septum formation protein